MSAQRERSAVEAAHRSILPNVAGAPWWGALLIATSATVIGYGIDAGHKELTHVFAACYIAGCVIAVLAVRQSGVFTAVIQPPLILFCAVPGAYWLFHGGKIDKLKDLLINCGYPLIERFPLMLGTAGVVLLIGLVRWYLGMTHRPAAHTDGQARTDSKSLLSGVTAKLASILNGSDDDEDGADEASSTRPRAARRSANASPRTGRAARSSRAAQRSDRTRSRHARAGEEDHNDPAAERRQRRRARQRPRDLDAADPPRRSRRPRPQGDPDTRSQPPREARRDSYGRRGSYERPPSRRFDPYESYEPPPDQFSRYEKPYESYEPPWRRATRGGPQGANPTHHPISQVRYRGSVPRDERPDDPRAEPRGRPRAPRRHQAESWEYDV